MDDIAFSDPLLDGGGGDTLSLLRNDEDDGIADVVPLDR